jgi:hypothetical protein
MGAASLEAKHRLIDGGDDDGWRQAYPRVMAWLFPGSLCFIPGRPGFGGLYLHGDAVQYGRHFFSAGRERDQQRYYGTQRLDGDAELPGAGQRDQRLERGLDTRFRHEFSVHPLLQLAVAGPGSDGDQRLWGAGQP